MHIFEHLPAEHSEWLPKKQWPCASRRQTTLHVVPVAAPSASGPVQSCSVASGLYEAHTSREAQASQYVWGGLAKVHRFGPSLRDCAAERGSLVERRLDSSLAWHASASRGLE